MNRIAPALLAPLLLLSACGSDKTATPAASPAQPAAKPAEKSAEKPADKPAPAPAESPKAPAAVDMDAAIKELMARPEDSAASIEIQHCLISFKGAPRMPPTVTRSKDEAKALAQKVYAEAVGGTEFLSLVKQYTNDSPPGIYPLTQAGRKGMVKSFGDVGWRLKVGEIGVAPWDAQASPFGWHIIKRLK
jgi:hypothetical protein